jgi:hypothetical protein
MRCCDGQSEGREKGGGLEQSTHGRVLSVIWLVGDADHGAIEAFTDLCNE